MRSPEAERRPRQEGGAQDGHGGGNVKDSVYGLHVFPQHAKLLRDSAIDPQVARERGYVSVGERAQLKRYGKFSGKCPVPGLLIPQRRLDGSVSGYQYRPDAPRIMDGKPQKYETPWQQNGAIDVPPRVRHMLADPSIPLIVTEGSRKADAAASAGLCCVSVSGVWSWRGTNAVGGKVALPDWHDIALNGRRVVLGFDSDVIAKPPVRRALGELAAYLGAKGAKVEYLHLPETGDGKTGLDDYLADEGAAGIWHSPAPNHQQPQHPTVILPLPPPRVLHRFTPRLHGRLTKTSLPGWCVMRDCGVASQVSTATPSSPTLPSPAGYSMTRCRSRSRACRAPGSPTRSARS